jgi:glycogen operon protein
VRALAAFRKETALSDGRFAVAEPDELGLRPVAAWLHPRGEAMGDEDWDDAELSCFGLHMHTGVGGEVLIIVNAGGEVQFGLPAGEWEKRIDTSTEEVACKEAASGTITVSGQSLLAFTPR